MLTTNEYSIFSFNGCYGGSGEFTKETETLIAEIKEANPELPESCCTLLAVDKIGIKKSNGKYSSYAALVA